MSHHFHPCTVWWSHIWLQRSEGRGKDAPLQSHTYGTHRYQLCLAQNTWSDTLPGPHQIYRDIGGGRHNQAQDDIWFGRSHISCSLKETVEYHYDRPHLQNPHTEPSHHKSGLMKLLCKILLLNGGIHAWFGTISWGLYFQTNKGLNCPCVQLMEHEWSKYFLH